MHVGSSIFLKLTSRVLKTAFMRYTVDLDGNTFLLWS